MTNESLKKCPFCGATLRRTRNGAAHPTAKELGRFCFMQGHHIGSKLLQTWNERHEEPSGGTTVAFHYVIKEGFPEFNTKGIGYPADLDFINECFKYVRENNPYAHLRPESP